MAEPQKMIHLTPAQRKRKKFSHPLTDKAPPPIAEEQLKQLLSTYFNKDEFYIEIGKSLMASYLRLLRSTVARYLYHWPVTRRFLDEMISSGTEAIVKVISNVKLEQLKDEAVSFSLTGLVESAIRTNIELTVNRLRGIVPAPHRTNYRREKAAKKPIYGNVEANLTSDSVKDSKEYNDVDSFIFEIEDAIEVIAQTELEKQILARENWGLSNAELSRKLNTSSQHIGRIRNYLRDRYMKLGEKYA